MAVAPTHISFDLAEIGLPEVPLFGRYRHRSARQRLGPHVHEGCYEVCYLAEGTQVFGVGGRDYAMRPGDVFVTFPDERHSSAGHPMEPGLLYWFHLRAPVRNQSVLGLAADETACLFAGLDALPSRCFPVSQAIGNHLAEAFTATEATLAEPTNSLSRLRVCAGFTMFLLSLIEAANQRHPRPAGGRMQRAIEFMETHVTERLTVPRIAEAIGLSPSWFKARFRREIGMPPAEYLLRRKVERAQQLLADPTLSVTRIAFRLGFSSSQHFAAVIRRYTGRAPKELRKNYHHLPMARRACKQRSTASIGG